MVNSEVERLVAAGFEGDGRRKMFLSARHYHGRTDKKKRGSLAPRVDATWERYDGDVYAAMRSHVDSHLQERPKVAYGLFVAEGGHEDTERLKRSYKNMYYRAKRASA